ncbi:MAG: ATP-binding cassette domain-containing protein [Lentisphaeria bacterium]|nr:ATP-binding cassette domain-containing protein [Lentisphaeria bacterium]
MTLLELDRTHCGYGTRPVLTGVSLAVNSGESVLLAGPNGCGKSTLLKAVIGLLPLTSGTIRFQGKDIAQLSTAMRVNAGIGYLRQTGNIFPGLTVHENLKIAGLTMRRNEFKDSLCRVLEVFDLLRPHMNKRSGALSGGQRQALAIAMVLLRKKTLYLLDEPTAGLSPKAAVDIMERIHGFIQNNPDQSVLMVEHRLELLQWINRAVILIRGEIRAQTSDMRQMLDPQWLEKHYF